MRTRVVSVLAAAGAVAGVLLASCAAPSTPVTAPTTASASDSPVPDPSSNGGDSGWAPCDDDTIAALGAASDDPVTLTSDDPGALPPYLPTPSCLIFSPDQGITISFFVGASATDFGVLESSIVAEQGAGVAVPGTGAPVLAAETWEDGAVIDLRYFAAGDGAAGDGAALPYIQATSLITNF